MDGLVTRQTLRQLLEEKAGIKSSGELMARIGGRAVQNSRLWNGHDPIGGRLLLRLLAAFPQISLQELSQVVEAKKLLTPPAVEKCRKQSAGVE